MRTHTIATTFTAVPTPPEDASWHLVLGLPARSPLMNGDHRFRDDLRALFELDRAGRIHFVGSSEASRA